MSHFIIGLTGGIGSGKTTVANLFARQGIEIIDADVLAREVVMPGSDGLKAIYVHFGDKILLDDGSLDRKQLRNLVFSHPEEKQWLDTLLHPQIRQLMISRSAQALSPYAILVVPLLLENNLTNLINRVLVVDAQESLQQQRTAARDNVSIEQVDQIMTTQLSRQDRLSRADDIINNNGDIVSLQQQVDKLHQDYLILAK
ncbi:dephospho-CoA kinase [Neptunicella sp. SCSIO 80796]|uniref:dephospho-CoA kinase n=1 Tax=Neptunicella plasticusilytica TaxID=3117012 RepID=UPI003A4DFA75